MNRSLFTSPLFLIALAACTQSATQAPVTTTTPQDQGLDPAEESDPTPLQVSTTESTYSEVLEAEVTAPSAVLAQPPEALAEEDSIASSHAPVKTPMMLDGVSKAKEAPTIGSSSLPPLSGSQSLGQRMSGTSRAGSVATRNGPARPAPSHRAPRLPTPQAFSLPNTESYTNYGVNDMTTTESDRFSTFGIDVDTASYTIARRKLSENRLPPSASVRVEEFINYFPYSYAPPTTEAPFAVHMEAAPDPFRDGHHLFRVGIKAQEIDLSDRKPVHLTFLVDVSGSMNRPDKLGLAKRSLNDLVNELQPGDTVALATYAGHVSAVLDPTDVAHRSQILAAIEDLSAKGSTAMNSGIQLAYQMAQRGYVAGHENRVIVVSDGDANVGPSTHTEILESIQAYAQEGITLSTIGFGMGNYKDTMMEQLANRGDGNYYYIDSYSESKKVFGKDLGGTLQVVAKDVKIQVEFNPEVVQSYRLVGYENRDIADRDFRNDTVDAGEIGTGHTVTALYELVLLEDTGHDLATVRIRNKKPGPENPAVEWMTAFNQEDLRADLEEASPDFKVAVAAANFAEMLRGSPYAADLKWPELVELAAQSQRPGVSEDDELLSLIQRAASLSNTRGPTAGR